MNAFKVSSVDSDSSDSSDELRKKFKELRPEDYNPQFVYIVVQKRISTRIMMPQGKDVVNPPPGTVLDNTVTRFAYKDFFLVPQAVNQVILNLYSQVEGKLFSEAFFYAVYNFWPIFWTVSQKK